MCGGLDETSALDENNMTSEVESGDEVTMMKVGEIMTELKIDNAIGPRTTSSSVPQPNKSP